MITVDVNRAMKDISRNFKKLQREQIDKATSRAINKTLLKARTEARRAVKDVYNIPQKNLEGIRRITSKPSFLEGYIKASTIPIPMDAFSPKFETATSSVSVSRKGVQRTKEFKRKRKSPAMGVSIEVYKSKRETVPFAFMIKGGKPRVFARGQYKTGGGSYGFIRRYKRVNKTGSDIPVKPLLSVTVHGAVINERVLGNIKRIVLPHFSSTMEHEINYIISQSK